MTGRSVRQLRAVFGLGGFLVPTVTVGTENGRSASPKRSHAGACLPDRQAWERVEGLVQRVRTALAALCLVVAALAIPQPVYAGPPLICHPLSIGNAKSLPSGDGPFGTRRDYNRDRLVEETLALLTTDMPVIVRMETLRRATIYASGINMGNRKWFNYTEEDRRLAYELLSRLMTRALSTEVRDKSEAVSWFDVGYLMECYQQIGFGKEFPGYDFIRKALSLRGEDPEIEFACALVTTWPKRPEHDQHLQKAEAGAKGKSMLAANLLAQFGGTPLGGK